MFVCDKCKREILNKGAYISHNGRCPLSEEIINSIIDDYTIHHCSIKDIEKKYSMGRAYFLPFIELRNRSEAISFGHINKPLKHSEETKLKMRNARLKWMKDNPEKTAWRSSNMSYPEKVFMERIIELEMDKKYLIVREKSVFPYYIDFAFENEKISVEIDGSQHLEKKRMEIDKKKDNLLTDLGWVVYRIPANEVTKNTDVVFEKLLNVLGNGYLGDNGFVHEKSKRQKEFVSKNEERIKNGGFTDLQIFSQIRQRKVERPPYEILLSDIETLGYVGTGSKYGVSDNSIRKWKKYYETLGKLPIITYLCETNKENDPD